jgi:hypothetical protein
MVLPALDEHTGIRVDFIFSYTPFETNAMQIVMEYEKAQGRQVYDVREDILPYGDSKS